MNFLHPATTYLISSRYNSVSARFFGLSRPAPGSQHQTRTAAMKSLQISFSSATALVFLLLSGTTTADGAHWPPRKQEIEVRLIALAVAYPRSSFFASDEVFVAEQELTKEESRFIKLVYDFLPYQSPLSESGLNYSFVHTITAVRDTSCDESLWEMRSLMQKRRGAQQPNSTWKYARETPISDLDQRQARLRCYKTTSDDFERSVRAPADETHY